MQFTTQTSFESRRKAELLVIPLWTEKGKIHWPTSLKDKEQFFESPILAQDFEAKENEVSLQYHQNEAEPRVLLLGLGDSDKITTESLRRAFSHVIKMANKHRWKILNVVFPDVGTLSEPLIAKGMAEGILLSNYQFTKLKNESIKKKPPSLIEKIALIAAPKNVLATFEKIQIICEGVYLARDLVNGNADDVTPQFLAKTAESLAKKNSKIHTTVLNKNQLQKKGLGLLLAVGQGSRHEPLLIISEYKGNPKSKEVIALVGKGVTYDTGGLNLKPTGSMETMKCDMGGAAAVLSTLQVASELKLKVNILAVVPTAENCIDSLSYKPGDVYTSYLGKTVEINNTDAEGRLILADALAYIVKNYKPTKIVDLATLTGAIDIALGSEAMGLFSNDDDLANRLLQASQETYERAWRMPLFDEYADLLKSEIADLKNTGGRPGGSITAAFFLKEFVDNTPWAHLDIASTAYLSEPKRYHPRFATGSGVRLLIEFLENQQAK